MLLSLPQAVCNGPGWLSRGDYNVYPGGIRLCVHQAHVRSVHGARVSRRIIGSMVAVIPLFLAYCARWSLSSSCRCRLVCRAHAAACRARTSRCPWHMGPCPRRSGLLHLWPARGASKPSLCPMFNRKADGVGCVAGGGSEPRPLTHIGGGGRASVRATVARPGVPHGRGHLPFRSP